MPILASNSFLPYPEVRKWNEIIKKKMDMGDAEQAILTYLKIQELGFFADNYTFPVLLKAAWRIGSSPIGFALHGQTIKMGFNDHVFVQTALVNMYGNLHCVGEAFKVFDVMPVRDLVTWNSMLDAYASNSEMDCAANMFDVMPLKDLSSFNIMISGYSSSGDALLARGIFDQMVARDIVSWNSMISAYVKAGDIEKGLELFGEMSMKNTITWNTIITGCLQSELFGSLKTGTKIHKYAIDNALVSSAHVTTALIDMYAKCGSIEQALQVFYKSQDKDIYCWNAIISALALHGYGYAALKIFSKMRNSHIRIQPDDITFIGLLNACSHSGLVQKGCQLFDSMQKEFGLSPKLEHYGCIVDLLGRSGHLDHAFQIVEAMPFEPGESVLGALLSACIVHQNLTIGEKVVKLVSCRGSYVSDGELMMFSNLYASCGNWEEAKRWREMMNSTGIVKTAGYSFIEVSGKFQKFLAGEMSKSDSAATL
ncbi:pentatricopeptide repeat-containing protein At3g29230-like isoform X2 [Mercurialis annua]|uniref:pentatricopeptide repeat-containing protein At3g29230-like isoform X2 n=1 Tax=Mercurialis annua TaxID=3986 RepID=UPI00215FE51F|nr:pentatricopeptide repeat-containing protein At3g29230-like isoform X2 [Mercurialis annua]